jgi:hypothetical protein
MKQDVFYQGHTALPKFIINAQTPHTTFFPSTHNVMVVPIVKKVPVFYRTSREISRFRESLHSFLTL